MPDKLTDAEIEQRCSVMAEKYQQMARMCSDPVQRLHYLLSAELQPGLYRWGLRHALDMTNGDICMILRNQIGALLAHSLMLSDCPPHVAAGAVGMILDGMPDLVAENIAGAIAVRAPKGPN